MEYPPIEMMMRASYPALNMTGGGEMVMMTQEMAEMIVRKQIEHTNQYVDDILSILKTVACVYVMVHLLACVLYCIVREMTHQIIRR